jgi:anti-sigma factor RsiW
MTTSDTTPEQRHEAMQQLLPWFATEQLPAGEAEAVREHLLECPACRADLEWERKLVAGAPPMPAGLDPEAALARLMPRLEPRAAPPGRLASLHAGLRNWLAAGWMPMALAAQAVAIALLLLVRPAPVENHQYRALSSAAAPMAAKLVVVFGPDARMDEVGRVLSANGARIVDGPGAVGAYVVAVEPAKQAGTISALKEQAGAELAEALTTQAQP